MGAAVGTRNKAEEVEGIVQKARELVAREPTVSDAELLKVLPPELQVEAKALAVFRELAPGSQTHAEVWEAVRAAVEDEAFVPQKRTLGKSLSRSAEFFKEMEALSAAAEAATVDGSPSATTGQATTATESSTEELETSFLMSPELKRPQLSKKVAYPPLSDKDGRPFPRTVVGSFSCHGQSDVGKLKENQDRGVVCYPFRSTRRAPRALLIVADGHGEHGHVVSDFAIKTLVDVLSQEASTAEADLREDTIKQCFLRTNEALAEEAFSGDATTSGTTCVAAILRPTFVITANVGDSRAVLGRAVGPAAPKAKVPFAYVAVDLTVDHKPDAASEKARIERCGGFVSKPEWSASSRVWLDPACTFPGLAMARSIGDHCVKQAGVVAEPEVKRYDFELKADRFLVLATDGIWEFLSSDDVVQIVAINVHSPKHQNKPNIAEICASEVIKVAIRQWKLHEDGYRDDITCSVVLLPALTDLWAASSSQDATAASA